MLPPNSGSLIGPIWKLVVAAILVIALSISAVPVVAQQATTASDEAPTAAVIVSALNLRAGPGLEYAKFALVRAGDHLTIIGQVNDCAWLNVAVPSGKEGWVSGNPRYVSLGTRCSAIAAIDLAKVTPYPLPTDAPTSPTNSPAATSVPPTPSPSPTPTPQTEVENNNVLGLTAPEGKGCIAIGNWVGPDLWVSGSHKETNEIVEVKIPSNEVVNVCLTPGRWGITISPIANFWKDMVFDIEIEAGVVIDFPLVRA